MTDRNLQKRSVDKRYYSVNYVGTVRIKLWPVLDRQISLLHAGPDRGAKLLYVEFCDVLEYIMELTQI